MHSVSVSRSPPQYDMTLISVNHLFIPQNTSFIDAVNIKLLLPLLRSSSLPTSTIRGTF